MKTKLILFALVFPFLTSCFKSDNQPINADDKLIGNWVNAVYKNDSISFERANQLIENQYGVSFREGGVFIERSSGWCGTPPLVFSDLVGAYQVSDSLIKVTTDNFPGNFNWQILSLTDTKLVVTRVITEQEKEHKKLLELFNEIQQEALSLQCTDSSNWSYTAYGAKACGGPQGYIAYPNSINKDKFLALVAAYTKAENEFNIKWGVISTCDVTAEPIGVKCEKGYPVLIY